MLDCEMPDVSQRPAPVELLFGHTHSDVALPLDTEEHGALDTEEHDGRRDCSSVHGPHASSANTSGGSDHTVGSEARQTLSSTQEDVERERVWQRLQALLAKQPEYDERHSHHMTRRYPSSSAITHQTHD